MSVVGYYSVAAHKHHVLLSVSVNFVNLTFCVSTKKLINCFLSLFLYLMDNV